MDNRALFAGELQPSGLAGPPDEAEVPDFVRPPSRSVAFSVRLTPDERAVVEAAARLCEPQLAAGTWAKTALLEAARRFVEAHGAAIETV